MNAQQRTLSDLKTGVTVQIDKGGKIRFGQQPMMDLPSVKIIDMASIAQFKADLKLIRKDLVRLEEFARLVKVEWIVLDSAEDEGVVTVQYPADIHRQLKVLGG